MTFLEHQRKKQRRSLISLSSESETNILIMFGVGEFKNRAVLYDLTFLSVYENRDMHVPSKEKGKA